MCAFLLFYTSSRKAFLTHKYGISMATDMLSRYLKDRFFGVAKNGSLVLFGSFEEAIEGVKGLDSLLYALQLKYKSHYGPTSYGNFDISYDVLAFNSLGEKTFIKRDGIECAELNFSDTTANSPFYKYGFNAKIADKNGTLQTKMDPKTWNNANTQSIEWLFKLMDELSQYDSWETYDQMIQKKREEEEALRKKEEEERQKVQDEQKTEVVERPTSKVSNLLIIPITESDPTTELNNLIGLKQVKEEVESIFHLAKIRKKRLEKGYPAAPSTLHLVFTGNPGTGKTTVARIIGQLYKSIGLLKKGHTVEVDRGQLVGQFVGQTAPKTNEIFKKSLDGVLFIDEAYSLNKENANDFGKEAIETLLKLMEDHREKILVIIAGYTKEMDEFLRTNPGLESRFPTKIHFEDYTDDELVLIFKKLIKEQHLELTEEANEVLKAKMLASIENERRGNARTVRNYRDKVLKNQAKRLSTIEENDDLLNILSEEDL